MPEEKRYFGYERAEWGSLRAWFGQRIESEQLEITIDLGGSWSR